MAPDALQVFHPLVRRWFTDEVGRPTAVQSLAWPRIAAGEHVLITAPTGSGKTLTAFLWALQQLLTGTWSSGRTRVLYVSPLKALNTDIRNNLQRPLEALTERFREEGEEAPIPAVRTRSGDTPAEERRRMLRHPPEILITTPESLNILLTSRNGRRLLCDLETVILDEVHAVAASKRGTHLITAVERLVPLSGELQRIALSATVRPLETVARWVGGYTLEAAGDETVYRRRRVATVRAPADKRYDIKVCAPEGIDFEAAEDPRWEALAREFKRAIRSHRSTLLFANNRRLTEKVTRWLNRDEDTDLAYSHHGSLSREVREVVEQRLKKGELPAIVATNSLELGIDIGALDEVILIGSPVTVASAIQRIGRAGHGVGEISRGRLYPIFARDFLSAAVSARGIVEHDVEEVRPVSSPLDVLAQVILSMVTTETWDIDRLFDQLRTAEPFHNLARRQLDLVLDMLGGRYADTRIRELKPRITVDRAAGTIKARPGSDRLLYMAGGTIADRGYYTLRREGSLGRVGELDEEFVWERSVGDTFTLGGQSWQIRRVTHNDVLVVPARKSAAMAPFWRADRLDRSFQFAERIGRLLERADQELESPSFGESLAREHRLDDTSVRELLDLLKRQKAATGVLPHRRRVLAERVTAPPDDDRGPGGGRRQLILHTFWGGKVNRPLATALVAAFEERYSARLEVVHDDDCLLLFLPRNVDPEPADLFALVDPDQVEDLLRQRLEATGFFGAHFRINAGTALLLPRSGFRHRTPLWLHRLRSKKLMEAVMRYGDFPILVETWRTCLQDEFELDTLKQLLREVREGEIELCPVATETPSPFAAELGWQLTNRYMYEDDTPDGGHGSGVRPDLLRELVFASQLRPLLPAALVLRFRRKVQRTLPGYAPRDAEELREWIEERLLVPADEWQELVAAMDPIPESELLASLEEGAVWVTLPAATVSGVAGLERVATTLRRFNATLGRLDDPSAPPASGVMARIERLALLGCDDPDREAQDGDPVVEVLAEWLRFQGPMAPARLGAIFGLDNVRLHEVLETLRESQQVVVDRLTRGSDTDRALEVCDVENLEILLRWLRLEARPGFEAVPAEVLPLFLAWRQGLVERGEGIEGLQARLERLFGYPAPAAAWEAEILPARLRPYYPAWLDSLMQESDLQWFGCGKKRLSFAFPIDRELFVEGEREGEEEKRQDLLPRGGNATLSELATGTGRSTTELTDELWRLAWEGRVSNDAFLAVRRGIENKWQPHEAAQPAATERRARRRGGRRTFDRWQSSRPFAGRWFALEPPAAPRDALDREELVKERVRVLLERYGVLFRELLQRELEPLQWGRVFRTLRIMELSGEVLAGQFFEGVRGLQFMASAAFRTLQQGLPEDAIYWLNAADPASLCGVDVDGLKERLPPRHPTTHLVYQGRRLVLVSRRRGKELEVRVAADHPLLEAYLEVLKTLLTREHRPLRSIGVERINGEPAITSPYAESLGRIFRTVREPHSLKLWKRYD